MPTEAEVGGLRALDPDFAFIASKAALELDDYLNGSAAPFTAVEQLASLLKAASAAPDKTVQHRFPAERGLMDPASAQVFTQAFTSSYNRPLRSDEIAQQALEIAKQLDKPRKSKVNRPQLELVRDFCAALSSCATMYRQRVYRESSWHAYRK